MRIALLAAALAVACNAPDPRRIPRVSRWSRASRSSTGCASSCSAVSSTQLLAAQTVNRLRREISQSGARWRRRRARYRRRRRAGPRRRADRLDVQERMAPTPLGVLGRGRLELAEDQPAPRRLRARDDPQPPRGRVHGGGVRRRVLVPARPGARGAVLRHRPRRVRQRGACLPSVVSLGQWPSPCIATRSSSSRSTRSPTAGTASHG